MIHTYIGYAATVLTTGALIPQLIKTWKTKKTHDISLAYYVVLALGITLWLIYGILINELPVIIANASGLSFILVIVGLKLRYG